MSTQTKLRYGFKATRRHWSNGRAERFATVYDDKGNIVCRVYPSTLDAAQWTHYGPYDIANSDMALEHWYRDEQ